MSKFQWIVLEAVLPESTADKRLILLGEEVANHLAFILVFNPCK
jgi:hypothetical protein